MSTHGMKARIARELGISGAAVSKLAKQGMPTDDVDAARQWRISNLQSGRMRPDPGPSGDTLLMRAQRMHDLAEIARQGGLLHTVADDVRAAMRAVPQSHRGRLNLSFLLMEALIGPHALAIIKGDGSHPRADAGVLDPDTDEAREFIGSILYMIACGEAEA